MSQNLKLVNNFGYSPKATDEFPKKFKTEDAELINFCDDFSLEIVECE